MPKAGNQQDQLRWSAASQCAGARIEKDRNSVVRDERPGGRVACIEP